MIIDYVLNTVAPFGIIIGMTFFPAGGACRTTFGQRPVQESMSNTLVGPTFGKKTFSNQL